MSIVKTAALAAVLVGAAGAGAALSPAAYGQAAVRVAPQRALEVLTGWGGSQIGVSIADVDPSDPKGAPGGVVIDEVTEGSPAAKAGLRKGDVVLEFDGERVRSSRQLTRLVQETVAGRKVPVVVQRDGQRTTVTVEPRESDSRIFRGFEGNRVLEEFGGSPRMARPPAPPPRPATPPSPAFPEFERFIWRGGNTLGVEVSELSPQLADYFGTKDGVLVTSVTDDSAAAKAGIKAGDVITSIDGAAVETPSDLRRRIQRLEDGTDFTIAIVRDKKAQTLKGKVEERRERRRTVRSTV
jgi:serine protease Do